MFGYRPSETDPNTDPHSFEVSPGSPAVAPPSLVVKNGLGYDFWTRSWPPPRTPTKGNRRSKTCSDLPDNTPNPHLWYAPKTMPAVASRSPRTFRLRPSRRPLFAANLQGVRGVAHPWFSAIAAFKAKSGDTVAATEPVADYLLGGHGYRQRHPVRLPGRHHERVDPSPQDITLEERILHQAPGQGIRLQPTGGRLAHHFDPTDREMEFPSSASTKRCRRPVTTTSPGCWPRSRDRRSPWLRRYVDGAL